MSKRRPGSFPDPDRDGDRSERRSLDSPSCSHGHALLDPRPCPKCKKDLRAGSTPKADGGGKRYDFGKNQLDLIPPEWPWALGMVLSRGAIKYDIRNWERGMKWTKPVGCALRHLFKFVCGERYDAETGCHHLAMAAWNMLALMTYDIRKIGENDLVGQLKWIEAVAINPGPELAALIAKKKEEADAARKS